MTLEIPIGARFLTALLIAFVGTVTILGGAGYLVTRVAVSPPRELFRAAAFEFELAPGWWCELDGTEYVCTPPGKPPHAAIAIIAMKERNDQDNLAAYEKHLRQPQRSVDRSNEAVPRSDIRFVQRRIIGAHEWVEALHSGSEIANYDTYYLAATTSYLGILVTMSVHKDHANRFIAQLNDMIKTLTLYQR
jgi:hypothetical protein